MECLSRSEILGASHLLKEAAIALESGLDPAPLMRRLWGILIHAQAGGRLEAAQYYYDLIETAFDTEGIPYHLSRSTEPLKIALENGCKSPKMRLAHRLELDLGV